MSDPLATKGAMEEPKYQKSVWYLPLPAFLYVEDVKKLARDNGLRIVDANVTQDRSGACEDPPKVTLRPEYAPKAEPEAAKVDAKAKK